ncbi:MAG: hypothetical protein KH281_01160 [Lachnospiraceae bacterium]|nr:hypothetical protein [Lachnospiraceae bacterium]
MVELYRYYRKRMMDEWQSLSMDAGMKDVFEEKYLRTVISQFGQLEEEYEELQTLEREAEKFIRMSEEQGI